MHGRSAIVALVLSSVACRTPDKYFPGLDSGQEADASSRDAGTDREFPSSAVDVVSADEGFLTPDVNLSNVVDSGPANPDVPGPNGCVSGTDTCPNGFRCTNSACPASCVTDQECQPSNYCFKKACAERCKVSAGNLIANGGFDKDAAGWVLQNARWVQDDAVGCSSSGAVKLDGDGGALSSCVPITALATYSFGVHMKADTETAIECGLQVYSDDNCTMWLVSTLKDQGAVNRWEAAVDAIQTPPEARSARMRCTTFAGVTGEFDLAFLKPGVVSEF